MDPPAHECSLESEDFSPSEAEKEASDQLERGLQSNETYNDVPSLERLMSVTLTISPSYVEDWNSTDAFREFYQNWRDASLERFDLDRLEFQPYYEARGIHRCYRSKAPQKRSFGISCGVKEWMEMTLDIRGPSDPSHIIETDDGDLVLDRRSQVKKPTQSGAYGSAIRKHETVLLPIYINLLRNFPQAADVESTNRLLKDSTRRLIWKHPLRETKNKRFFYSERCNAKGISMITRNLKKETALLSRMLWGLLRQSSPIRTPEEEHAKLFKGAEVCALPESAFGRAMGG
ncbi:hypothetical protein N7527_007495 [Penicillium freii]|nr:hypothetical protein N7527_007495 [Penicillium freii]